MFWQSVTALLDLDGDSNLDLLWRHDTDGWLAVWRLWNGVLLGGLPLSPNRMTDHDWVIVAPR